jgi:transcriptional regulator with XRE-family HTH domain
VRERLKDMGWSQQDLAQAVGCTQAAVAAVLKPNGLKQSALVPRISKAVGLKKPTEYAVEVVDPDRAELAELLDTLSDEAVRQLLGTARLLTRNK